MKTTTTWTGERRRVARDRLAFVGDFERARERSRQTNENVARRNFDVVTELHRLREDSSHEESFDREGFEDLSERRNKEVSEHGRDWRGENGRRTHHSRDGLTGEEVTRDDLNEHVDGSSL